MARRFQRVEGKYSLTAEADDLGYYHLVYNAGTHCEIDVGLVSDPENFGTAVDEAEEEARILLAQAREEFGIS